MGACGLVLLAACNNSPYPDGAESGNTVFTALRERSPRYLDPTASYASNETPYTYSIYEPLYGYHYLKRPYTLVPKLAEKVVEPRYFDRAGRELPSDAPASQVAEAVYDIPIKKGAHYAPHPAFAKDAQGRPLYFGEAAPRKMPWRTPLDFPVQATREVVADDFVYAFKRTATTRTVSPSLSVMSSHVIGLDRYAETIRQADKALLKDIPRSSEDKPFLDFRRHPLEGVQALGPHLLRIRLNGKYPQWNYWLAMVFTAPIPWEADAFYANPGFASRGLSLNVWPVGSGPYRMTVYEQDRRHVLERNPAYREATYPCEGSESDRAEGLLADCGKRLPLVDRWVFSMEKEKGAIKSKFKQGYLDVPEVERPDWGVDLGAEAADSPEVAAEFESKGQKLPKFVDVASWYLGFNWLDPVVGRGDTPEQQLRNRKLRQAIAIVLDWEAFSEVFPDRGGEAAMSPVPPGLFGNRHGTRAGLNPFTHRWVDGKPVRRSLEEAKALLAQAGYPEGRDARTGQPLVLYYDYLRVPTPEIKSELDWTVQQFAKLNIQLEIRASDYNQFQDKMRKGTHQVYFWGWNADYPDAENYLFLLYGPNGKAKFDGENATNFQNDEYDRLFEEMRTLEDGPRKQAVIDRMVAITQEEAVWSMGWYPWSSGAYQAWMGNGKPSIIIRDQLRYLKVDAAARTQALKAWNRPVHWPLLVLGGLALLGAWSLRRLHLRREQATATKV